MCLEKRIEIESGILARGDPEFQESSGQNTWWYLREAGWLAPQGKKRMMGESSGPKASPALTVLKFSGSPQLLIVSYTGFTLCLPPFATTTEKTNSGLSSRWWFPHLKDSEPGGLWIGAAQQCHEVLWTPFPSVLLSSTTGCLLASQPPQLCLLQTCSF